MPKKVKITLTVAGVPSVHTPGMVGEDILKVLEAAGFNVVCLTASEFPGVVTVKSSTLEDN